MNKYLRAIIPLSLLFTVQLYAQSADAVMNKVRQKYESLKNVCADFEQTFVWKLAEEQRVVRGSICAQDGVRFRIDTPDQFIVTDGKVVWTLNKGTRQVMVDNATAASGDHPFLKEFMDKYNNDYTATFVTEQPSPEVYAVLLTAKSENQFVPRVALLVDKKQLLLREILQTDINGNQTRYVMSNINTEAKLTASDFQFQKSGDFEIIDLR